MLQRVPSFPPRALHCHHDFALISASFTNTVLPIQYFEHKILSAGKFHSCTLVMSLKRRCQEEHQLVLGSFADLSHRNFLLI